MLWSMTEQASQATRKCTTQVFAQNRRETNNCDDVRKIAAMDGRWRKCLPVSSHKSHDVMLFIGCHSRVCVCTIVIYIYILLYVIC